MGGETVVLLTAATATDPYSGETVADWSLTPVETTLETAWPPEPRPSDEPVQDARNAVVSGFTLYFDSWPAVTPQNRMRVRDRVYDVLGEPAEWRWPSGEVAGSVVQVGRTVG
jgi:hypothetical protein